MLTLIIDNNVITGWQKAAINRNMESGSGSFDVELLYELGLSEII